MNMKEAYEATMKYATWSIVAIVFLLLVGLLCGCTTTKYVEVEKVKTDTIYKSKVQKDSIWLHDSVYVSEKGDTIRIEKWHTKFIEKLITDTVYQHKIDSIPVPYPKEVYVEKKLNWLQTTLMWTGGTALLALLGFAFYKSRKFIRNII